jgi:hypothetical protein
METPKVDEVVTEVTMKLDILQILSNLSRVGPVLIEADDPLCIAGWTVWVNEKPYRREIKDGYDRYGDDAKHPLVYALMDAVNDQKID